MRENGASGENRWSPLCFICLKSPLKSSVLSTSTRHNSKTIELLPYKLTKHQIQHELPNLSTGGRWQRLTLLLWFHCVIYSPYCCSRCMWHHFHILLVCVLLRFSVAHLHRLYWTGRYNTCFDVRFGQREHINNDRHFLSPLLIYQTHFETDPLIQNESQKTVHLKALTESLLTSANTWWTPFALQFGIIYIDHPTRIIATL